MKWADLKKADEIKAKEEAARKAKAEAEKARKKAEKKKTDANLTDDQKGFRQRAQNEEKRKAEILDSRYYLSVAFESYPALDAFCNMAGANPDELYIDGKQLAERLGVPVQSPDFVWPQIHGYDKDYASFAMDFDPMHCRRREIPVGEQYSNVEPITMDELESSLMDDFAGLQEILLEQRKEWEDDYAYYKVHRPVKTGWLKHRPQKSTGFNNSYYDVYVWFNSTYQYQEFMNSLGLNPAYNIVMGDVLMKAIGTIKAEVK